MAIPEPPIQADDTQPNQSLVTESNARRPVFVMALIAVIVISGFSLVATLGVIFSGRSTSEMDISVKMIALRVDGVQNDVETTAATVTDLLQEQSIDVGENDIVVPDGETTLTDAMLVTVARARTVTLILDGEITTLQTPFDSPAQILEQADITLSETDRIFVDGTRATESDLFNWTVPANEIVVQRAYTITIADEGTETQLTTTASTVGDVLFEANIDVFVTDNVSPELTASLSDNLVITIERARPVTINVDDTAYETRVQGTTVADALTESGIILAGLDYTIPAFDADIAANEVITVLRVTESIETQDIVVPFETAYQADASLELDQQQVIQAGAAGLERFSERVRFENGIEVSREPIGTELVTESQNQIVSYGNNIVLRTVNTPEGPREYWRVIRAYATSYHPEALGGDNITAIGMELRKGIVASDPDIIPYRTNVYVPNYGIGLMADTGGARSSPYWIDLGYSDEDWVGWSQYVDVYLLTPIPADIDYLLPNFRSMRGIPDN